jgi:hypothetical protein
VHGAIHGKWSSLGSETGFLGYPTTDESGTPDGIGRYNHFQGGSIYWTPATNAHEVHGAIWVYWASVGWERSSFGYPISDETDAAGGRISYFQHGSIYWSPATGAQPQQGPWLARLSPTLIASLLKAGITEPAALVPKLQSQAAVLSLSQTTGTKPITLVSLAARADMARILGEQKVSLEQLQLLECAGLATPAAMGKFAGREADCAAYLTYTARRLRMAPPTQPQVKAWVQAASQAKSALPDPKTLLPQVGKGQPRRLRARAIGEGIAPGDAPVFSGDPLDNGGLSAADRQALLTSYTQMYVQAGLNEQAAAMYALAIVSPMIVIKAGESEGYKEFQAPGSGLYRADISLRRAWGSIAIKWVVEKPLARNFFLNHVAKTAPPVASRETPSKFAEAGGLPLGTGTIEIKQEFGGNTGAPQSGNAGSTAGGGVTYGGTVVDTLAHAYTPILQGDKEGSSGNPFDAGDYSLYFWIKPADVPVGGKLRLRLVVEKNVDGPTVTSPPSKPGQIGDPDSSSNQPPPKPDPTISGSIVVTRQTATPIEYNKPCTVPWVSPDSNGRNRANQVQWFQAPLYTPPGGVGERAFRLTATAVTDPNLYQQFLPDWVISNYDKERGRTGHSANDGICVGVDVIRDSAFPVAGAETFHNGVSYLDHAAAVENGIYQVVIGAGAQQLMETGYLMRRYSFPQGETRVTVSLELEGGKVETWYMPELQYLRLSGEGGHADDNGFGDFVIETKAVLGNAAVVSGSATHKQKSVDIPKWAAQLNRYEVQDIPAPGPWTDGDKTAWCMPHVVLAHWTPEQLEQYDAVNLAIGVRAVHQMTFWESVEESFDPFVKALKALIDAGKTIFEAYGGSVLGAVSSFSSFVQDCMHMDDQQADRYVEYFGTAAMTTGKQWPWPWGLIDDDALARFFRLRAAAGSTCPGSTSPWADEKTGKSGDPGCVTDYTGSPADWIECEIRMRKVAAPYSVGWVDSIQFTTSDDPCPKWGYGALYGLTGPATDFGGVGGWPAEPFNQATDFDKFDDIYALPESNGLKNSSTRCTGGNGRSLRLTGPRPSPTARSPLDRAPAPTFTCTCNRMRRASTARPSARSISRSTSRISGVTAAGVAKPSISPTPRAGATFGGRRPSARRAHFITVTMSSANLAFTWIRSKSESTSTSGKDNDLPKTSRPPSSETTARGMSAPRSGLPGLVPIPDIGGFILGDPDDPSYRELFVRWFQFGTFCPIFRVHGTRAPDRNELWSYGADAQRILVSYDKLRYRLLPYIYSVAWMITNQSYTPMRALVMDFPSDRRVLNIGDQYMFGPGILVSPITEEGAISRHLYLPAGVQWRDFWTGAAQDGGRYIDSPAPLDRIPLYVRTGSIIPLGPDEEYAAEKPADPLEVRIYTGADGSFVLYEDENDSYNYERGIHASIAMQWNEQRCRS